MADYAYKTEPYDHQRAAFEKYRDEPVWGHLWDPRTGKSKVIIDTGAYNFERGRINAALVVAPNGVHTNWVRNEIPAHCPDRVRPGVFAYQTHKAGTLWHQKAVRENLCHDGFAWLCMSYDGLTTDRGAQAAKEFLMSRRCLQVIDEAHRIKTADTDRTRYVIASGKHAAMRRFLTGTLVGNEPFDVYCPMAYLDPEFWQKLGFRTLSAFKAHFAEWVTRERYTGMRDKKGEPIKRRFKVVDVDDAGEKKYRNLTQLNTYVAKLTDRISAEAVLDMPPDVYEMRYFDMAGEQCRLYQELHDEFITFVQSGEMVTADLAIVRAMRLQQITCGYVPTDDGDDVIHEIPGKNPRLDCLMEVVEDTPGQGIIWARFTPDIDKITQRLESAGESYVRYDGKVRPKQRADNVGAFQEGRARWFVGNAGAGGEGLPLYAANTVIYYSSTYKLTERLQSQDRPKKKGKREHIGIIDLVCAGTVDEAIIKALRDKKRVASVVMGDTIGPWL